jgi:hypothetical protein
MTDHKAAWAGSGITFRAHTPEQRQRLAEAKAERRKVWRVRVREDGTLERKQFASRDQVPLIEGWSTHERAARRFAARLLPTPTAVELPAVILLPAPPRYNRDKPRCSAKTRKGVPCQAQGNGRGGRCRNHGGRTPEGALSDRARVRARHGPCAAARPMQHAISEMSLHSRSKRGKIAR